jgi:tetratricopeptide (TPR) repeat protein
MGERPSSEMANSVEDGYFDLGSFHRTISTNNPTAQLWSDRGMVWSYGFNRSEALSCFEEVIAADPKCAMGYWGIAYAAGAYYNKPWELYDKEDLKLSTKKAYDAAHHATTLLDNATPEEQALVRALAARHPQAEPSDDMAKWDQQYASSMRDVYEKFSDDLDIAVLYAESLMNLTPWKLWDPYTGHPTPGSRAQDVKKTLDRAFTLPGAWDHPGLLHLYIHMIEMTREPELGLKAADRLRFLVPEAGHLTHMPSHLDVLVGDYRNAIEANARAIVADDKYLDKVGALNMYTFYRVHDIHSLIYAAMLCGKSEVALEYTARLEAALPESLLSVRSPPMAEWLEAFLGVRAHVLIRFGKWEEILQLDIPKDTDLYCVTAATLHYAKGVAYAATGKVTEAEKEQKLFKEIQAKVPDTRYDYPNKCTDELKVAEAMLAGEIEYRRGNFDLAFEHLRESIQHDDNLLYSEPWGWMQPTRHAYAALLLEQGHVEEAADVYGADLGFDDSLPRGHQHPNNIWALKGMHECLTRLGRVREARMLELPLKQAQAVADVDVVSSCYCKTEDTSGRAECCAEGSEEGYDTCEV